MTAIDALPDGRLVRSRVVEDPGEALSAALDRSLTGYAVLEPQDALLLDADDAGVIAFEEGVPVGAYHGGTDRGGPAALADLAVPGPYSADLYAADAGTLAPVTRGDRAIPPGMAAERLAGDADLADRTLAAAERGRGPGGDPDRSPSGADGSAPGAGPSRSNPDRPAPGSGGSADRTGGAASGAGDASGSRRSDVAGRRTSTPGSERARREGVPREPASGDASTPSDDREPDAVERGADGESGADAVAAFLEDERKIEAIREQARGQARDRADEWGLTDHLADPPGEE